jgi:hypothetical protein
MESLYDYGARSGFWRLHRLFAKKKTPCTVFAVGMALERNPAVCLALKETPYWEVASHGYRWMDYQNVDEETERDHIARSVHIHERLLGKRPVGIYQGKVSICRERVEITILYCCHTRSTSIISCLTSHLLVPTSQTSTRESWW